MTTFQISTTLFPEIKKWPNQFFISRHGLSCANIRPHILQIFYNSAVWDPSLCDKGAEYTINTGKLLRKKDYIPQTNKDIHSIDIFVSPLLRTWMSAVTMYMSQNSSSEKKNINLIISPFLNENYVYGFGYFTGDLPIDFDSQSQKFITFLNKYYKNSNMNITLIFKCPKQKKIKITFQKSNNNMYTWNSNTKFDSSKTLISTCKSNSYMKTLNHWENEFGEFLSYIGKKKDNLFLVSHSNNLKRFLKKYYRDDIVELIPKWFKQNSWSLKGKRNDKGDFVIEFIKGYDLRSILTYSDTQQMLKSGLCSEQTNSSCMIM